MRRRCFYLHSFLGLLLANFAGPLALWRYWHVLCELHKAYGFECDCVFQQQRRHAMVGMHSPTQQEQAFVIEGS